MKYKGESIENMEWVESYENFDMDVYNLLGVFVETVTTLSHFFKIFMILSNTQSGKGCKRK